jgi:hypothetical protein
MSVDPWLMSVLAGLMITSLMFITALAWSDVTDRAMESEPEWTTNEQPDENWKQN